MKGQEILANLSQLEQELQSIKSARLLVEDTVGAYAEVRKDIKTLLDEFESVNASLISITEEFDSENENISSEIQQTIGVLKGQLDTLNTSFASQCNLVITHFMESISKTTEGLVKETSEITAGYKRNNDDLMVSIRHLEKVHNSLINASERVSSLKGDIAILHDELSKSQENQDSTLANIASQLQATGKSHTDILSQIANDLKSSQDAQDDDLALLKNEQCKLNDKLELSVHRICTNVDSHKESLLSKLNVLHAIIDNRIAIVEGKLVGLENSVKALVESAKTSKTIIIVNIVLTIIAIFVAYVR